MIIIWWLRIKKLPEFERYSKLMKDNSEAFNSAGFSSIKQVDKRIVVNIQYKIPMKGEANPVMQSFIDGELIHRKV